jgi:CheY-like chemotaxis protein
MVRRILVRDFNCSVFEAEDGAHALELLDGHTFDCVFLDLKMPLVGGLEVLEELRQSDARPTLPVVVMSAQRDERTVRQAIALGILDFVIKDSDVERLRQRLGWVFNRLLTTARSRRAGRAAAGRGSLDSQSLVLVVDGNADFRHFCRDVLQATCRVVDVSSGGKALRKGLEAPPEVMLVGSDIGTMQRASLAKKIHGLKAFEHTMLLAVVDKDEMEATQALGLFDEVIRRSFLPEVFLDALRGVMPSEDGDGGFIGQHPELSVRVKSALEQVLGMMLTTEATVLPTPPPDLFAARLVDVPIRVTDQDVNLRLTLCASAAATEEIARRLLQLDDATVGPEDIQSSLAEVGNMVAGRIQGCLSDRGIAAQLGLPAPFDSTVQVEDQKGAIRIAVEFSATADHPLTLGTILSECSATEAASGQGQAGT